MLTKIKNMRSFIDSMVEELEYPTLPRESQAREDVFDILYSPQLLPGERRRIIFILLDLMTLEQPDIPSRLEKHFRAFHFYTSENHD